MVKQESQRREREVSPPVRSLESSTEVQKQVGQTMVQLPQVRQRSATSSQRGCSRLRSRSSRRSSARICRPIEAAVRATTDRGGRRFSRSVAARCGSSASTSRPTSEPASSDEALAAVDELGRARGRSRHSAFGPVFIETQKQVPPASPQLTATMKAAVAPRLDSADRHAAPFRNTRSWMAIACSSQARTPMKAKRSPRRGLGRDAHRRRRRAAALHKLLHRRMQEPLPGMRPDGVAEQGVVVAPRQPIASAVLLVGPAARAGRRPTRYRHRRWPGRAPSGR